MNHTPRMAAGVNLVRDKYFVPGMHGPITYADGGNDANFLTFALRQPTGDGFAKVWRVVHSGEVEALPAKQFVVWPANWLICAVAFDDGSWSRPKIDCGPFAHRIFPLPRF